MAFIDRVDPTNMNRTIHFHELSAAFAKVGGGMWTLAEFKSRFGLDATDDPQINKLITFFQNLSLENKRIFHSIVEREGILWESRRQTRSEFMSDLGITK